MKIGFIMQDRNKIAEFSRLLKFLISDNTVVLLEKVVIESNSLNGTKVKTLGKIFRNIELNSYSSFEKLKKDIFAYFSFFEKFNDSRYPGFIKISSFSEEFVKLIKKMANYHKKKIIKNIEYIENSYSKFNERAEDLLHKVSAMLINDMHFYGETEEGFVKTTTNNGKNYNKLEENNHHFIKDSLGGEIAFEADRLRALQTMRKLSDINYDKNDTELIKRFKDFQDSLEYAIENQSPTIPTVVPGKPNAQSSNPLPVFWQ